jgi:DNA repair exonuclease SbcCD ATPase subunit
MSAAEKKSNIVPIWAGAIRYPVSREEIETKRAALEALSADTRDGYEKVRLAIAECRGLRVAVKQRHKDLKRDPIDYGRAIDKAASDLIELIASLEDPLQAKKDAADAEKERLKKEVAERERRELEEKLRAEREAEEARLKAERDAEEQRLAAERAKLEEAQVAFAAMQREAEALAKAEREAESERIAAERAQLEADRKAAQDRQRAEDAALAEERAKVDVERRALEIQKAEAERAEAERVARIEAEKAAVAAAERARVEAEERAAAEAERKAAEEQRVESMRPDLAKVRSVATALRECLKTALPERVDSMEATQALGRAMLGVSAIADELEAFGAEVV